MPAFGPADLAIVIPTRDRWHILSQTLAGLAAQSVQGFETVIVVDGEDQDVPDLGSARVVVKPHGGPGAARNAGVAATDRPLVLFLGDDMIPTPRVVELHLEAHNREPEETVAVLGLAEWHPDIRGDRIARWLDWSYTQFDYALITTADAGPGRFFTCNLSLKRQFFLGVGGFDEAFTTFYEDTECGWRLKDRGLRVRYIPDAVVHHLHRYDWKGIERRFEWVARGERLMHLKHPDFDPWFLPRMEHFDAAERTSVLWPLVVDRVPSSSRRVRRWAEERANTAYYQRLAPVFLNAWEAAQGLDELKRYLGDDFDEQRLWNHHTLVEDEADAAVDEQTFYRTSTAYLYDLTVFAMSGSKVPYLSALRRQLPRGASVLDYGCGIGNDGLQLLGRGYRVAFADFDNPSTRYLRWRLADRGLDAEVYDLDADVPAGFDAAFAFDVIEHVDDAREFLGELERRAAIVAVNLLEPDPEDTHLHRSLPIAELLDHAADCGLLSYGRFHEGRSHLAIYRSPFAGAPTATSRVRSRVLRRAAGRARGPEFTDLDRLEQAWRRRVQSSR
jgi:GT2 family glycosyltransferase/2-polyprenyl-3-methyl-5-hydroxy-6-metoxy-1,4-benzoquinol methylase